jgi:hypothetical protein
VKFSIGALAIGALLVGGASRAEALPLTPADTTCTTNTTSNLNASALYTLLDGCFDVTAATTPLLYKQNSGTGGTEEGTFASSYSTSFIGTTGDWSGATITYGSGAAAYCTECYLVVKDGNHNPAQYFFDISGWNGTETINLTGFWPTGGGSISHVSIHGITGEPPDEDPPSSVPEPTSFLLISAGFGMAALRLRKNTKQ